jgi:hypothetical protein
MLAWGRADLVGDPTTVAACPRDRHGSSSLSCSLIHQTSATSPSRTASATSRTASPARCFWGTDGSPAGEASGRLAGEGGGSIVGDPTARRLTVTVGRRGRG